MTTPAKQPKAVHGDESISAYGPARATVKGAPLSTDELRKIDAYWQASLTCAWGCCTSGTTPCSGSRSNWSI